MKDEVFKKLNLIALYPLVVIRLRQRHGYAKAKSTQAVHSCCLRKFDLSRIIGLKIKFKSRIYLFYTPIFPLDPYKTHVFNKGYPESCGCSKVRTFSIPIFFIISSDLRFTTGAIAYIFSRQIVLKPKSSQALAPSVANPLFQALLFSLQPMSTQGVKSDSKVFSESPIKPMNSLGCKTSTAK